MTKKSAVDQERINVALVRALLEVWQAGASQLSLNVEITAKLASLTDDEEERQTLIAEVLKSRDSVNLALEKIKKAVSLIDPDALEEDDDAED